ncbi:hypothetical protein AKJ09_00388 [Labilithrix luteola]|uniref:Uncharacterized protein n=2 Tax=Labilithrix luteola TaxID=1391654 RepID=A0A0K1PKV3_9BACT|nr:hypothetical protein AKJ09_00388 [Labilithrix luteola]
MDRAFGEQRNSITATQGSAFRRTLGMSLGMVIALLLGVAVAQFARGGDTTSETIGVGQ